jgi:hypothetical protein
MSIYIFILPVRPVLAPSGVSRLMNEFGTPFTQYLQDRFLAYFARYDH